MGKTVILIHEIYGITESLLNLKDKLMGKNCSVILPSLYKDNYHGFDERESYNKFYSEVGLDGGLRVIDDIIEQNRHSEIYLVGFSVGAAISWMFSADRRVKSIIGIYGSRIREYLDIRPIVQSYLFFCNEKSFDIMPVIDEIKKKENVTVKIINGEHGFYNFRNASNEKLFTEIENEIFSIIEK